ncbi:MAG TPA: hypothetical protein DCZ92_09870 [Elusimicrobia bacterium]|nr:MAG: hypothetical protein A2016_05315 [Elusimicrobia bacterium GWF2_62_30]HBA61107.1 hypothetical protein [Elusimicrobiota bacterium]
MRIENKYKFMAAVVALFLLPFLLLSRQFVYGTKSLQKNDMLRYLEMRTLAGSRVVANELGQKYNLSLLAADKKFREGGSAGRKAVIELKVKENPIIYSELAVLALSGSEAYRASAGKALKSGFDYAKSDVFAAVKQTGASAGAVEYGEYTPPALIIVEPASSGGGKTEFYLAGRLSLAYLGELVRLMGRNSQGNFGLVDGGGQMIADSTNMSTMKPGVKAMPEILKMLSVAMERGTPSYTREVLSGGRSYLASVANVPGSKWWLYEIVDPDGVPSIGTPSRVKQVIFSGIMIIFMFGIVTYLLALRWLVRGKDEGAEGGA